MPTTIESLELEVQSSSTSATSGIDALSASLSKLKNAVKGGVGLTSVTNQLKGLNAALQGIDSSSAGKLDTLSNSLSKLSGLGNIKISSSIANQIKNLGSAATSLNGVDFSGISRLASSLQPLTTLGKSNLTSFISQLGKLPQLAQTLNTMNIPQFASQLNQLSSALAPLASQLNTVSTAFSRLPANIRSTVTATNAMATANNTASTSYINLWAKLRMARAAVMSMARVIASWITESNSYIENLNLFTASMGEYTEQAKAYAEQVADIMGIDPGEWMRNQGVFMTITKGFGVASDRAYLMSKNLTQLGYDLSSFFNISFEDSMQKLTSGISGELEPLRRLGYDLSVARLQQEAYNLGIDKSVIKMTQAEKAQLRYYAIMTQVTTAQGDMARTLNAPANQLRILKSQVVQVARALGNVFIPILNVVLPYLIAFAKVLRMVINLIGKFVGFTLPEIDYSGISAGSDAVGDLADSEGDATKAAKKLKNALLGIDELNVISPNDDSSSGSGSGIATGSDLGFELPEYDFLDNAINQKVEDLVKKFKEWAGLTDDIDTWAEFFHTKLGRILILVGEIAAGFLAWKFAKSFLNGLAWLQNLKTLGLTTPLTVAAGIVLTLTGLTIEWTGLTSIIQDGIDNLNFGETVGGAIMTTIGGSLIGKAASGLLAKAGITSAAIEGGMGAGLAGAIFGGSIAAIVAGIPAFVVGIWSAIKEGLNLLNGLLITGGATLTGAGIGALIGLLGGPIGAGIGALIGLVVGALTDLGIWLYQNWDSVSAWFSKKWSELTGWWNNTAVPWFKGLPGWFKDVLENIGKWFSELPGKIGYALGFALGKVVQWTTDTYATLKEKIPQIIESVRKWFSELPGKIYKAISDTVSKIGKWCSDVITKVKQEVPKIIDKIVEFFKGLPDKLKQLGADIWQGLIDGLTNAWESLKKAVKDFVDGFVQGFKDALGIHSPSTVFESIGGYVIAGFKKGIELFEGMASTVKEWAGSVVEWFTKGQDGKGIVENFKETAGNIVSGFKDKIGSTYTAVKSNVTTWASSVKDWFSSPSFGGINSTSFSTFANNTIEGFKTKIGTAYTNTKSNITTWASNVKTWFTNSSFGGVNNSNFQTFANNTIEGFKTKIGNAYTNTKSNITTWASNVKTWFTDNGYGGINNTNWQTFANNVVTGFKDKIGTAYTNTKSNITTWASNVKSWFSDIASNSAFSGFATNVIDGFKSRVGDYYTTAKSNMTTFGSSVKSWFTDNVSYSKFYDVASDVVNGFKNGIGELYSTCKKTISSWGSSIIDWFKDKLDVNSPSREFYKIGGFTIDGFNNAISTEGKSTKGIMSAWSDSFTDISPKIALAVDTSAVESFDPSKVYGRALSAEVQGSCQVTANGFVEGMEQFYRDYVEPTLNRIADDTKRQADKEEQTIVQVGNRTVTDAVTTQKKANGYVFAT